MLYGRTVGFIGYGSIARCLRPLLAPFGCPIAVYDPWIGAGYLRSQGVEPIALEQLLQTSQIIFVLASPSSENRALLSRELLAQIQPGAVLVLDNCEQVIDAAPDLARLLSAAPRLTILATSRVMLRLSAERVFPIEPLPTEHPIRQAPGAVLSAHRAGSVTEGLWELGRMVVDDLEAIAQGLPPQRLQLAQPELVGRFATNRVPRPSA
jgi:phosphoglycerate dehydrogenase-like enzyme